MAASLAQIWKTNIGFLVILLISKFLLKSPCFLPQWQKSPYFINFRLFCLPSLFINLSCTCELNLLICAFFTSLGYRKMLLLISLRCFGLLPGLFIHLKDVHFRGHFFRNRFANLNLLNPGGNFLIGSHYLA